MKVKWLGHSCFLLTSSAGLKVLTDPYNTGSGLTYTPVKETPDIVTISHEHGDHNNPAAAQGQPAILKGPGTKTIKGIEFRGIPAYHDESKGRQRGPVTIFCFTLDGITLCHLGDLGQELEKEQLKEIGAVGILMLPVGGYYTIDAASASRVSQAIAPKVLLPMHYKTSKCSYPISGVEEFLKGKAAVRRLDSSEIEFQPGQLPATTEIIVLEHAM